jgi:hypothetical protein
MPQVKRVVIGVGPDKKSAVIHRDSPNHQEVPGIFWRSTLWAATELPVNITATITCIGVIPALTILSSSCCSDIPNG